MGRRVAYVKKTSAFGYPCMCGYMEVWGADRCFCKNGNELSVSVGMGSFLVQLSGLTVTEEGFSMKNSNDCFLNHSSKLHQIITYIFYKTCTCLLVC
jgi:hypothetical protein